MLGIIRFDFCSVFSIYSGAFEGEQPPQQKIENTLKDISQATRLINEVFREYLFSMHLIVNG
jgi:hypothetical protein